MKNKYLFIIGGIMLLAFCFYKMVYAFAPGSYPYAEIYTLNYPEKRVIEALENVKANNNLEAAQKWKDDDSTDHWNLIYFDIQGKIVLTWTKPNDENSTNFAFVSIQEENNERKTINNDFGFFENKKLIKMLEDEILNKIKIELAKNNNP